MADDPYAKYGGEITAQSTPVMPQTASDPYAKYGGEMASQPAPSGGNAAQRIEALAQSGAAQGLPSANAKLLADRYAGGFAMMAGGGGIQTVGREVPTLASKAAQWLGIGKTAQAEPAGTNRVPLGKLTKELPNPDPYKFKGAPQSMEIAQSTNVGKHGYSPEQKVMTVEYKNGQVYSYHGVPPEIYQGAQDAESVGSYIARNIKGRYETVRRGSVLVKK